MPSISAKADRVGRRLSARRRTDPDFLIIGAQKSGTTSLYRYLQELPGIDAPILKEIHYFDVNYSRGPNWYRSWFPIGTRDREWITGEASPLYMLYPHIPARVHAFHPGMRLVAVLRHPIDRAYSHFHHSRAHGREPLDDFAQAVHLEAERTADAWERVIATEEHQPELQYFTYLRRGRYAEQLERWFEVFPREALQVVISEDFFDAPAETTLAVADHIGLTRSASTALDLQRHNTRSYTGLELSQDLRDELGAYFADDTRRLEQLLGRPTGWTF